MENNNSMCFIVEENLCYEMAVISVLGDRREQQDSFGYKFSEKKAIVVVCDGMGGYNGGREASRVAVSSVLESYKEDSDDTLLLLKESTQKANERVLQLRQSEAELASAGSTLVSLFFDNRELFWNSVGDSRAYLIRNEQLVQLTLDHNYNTVLQERVETGLLASEDIVKEQLKGEALISFIGMDEEILIDYNKNALMLQKLDKIIVMSDGLYKLLSDDEICRIVTNFNNISEALNALETKAQKKAAEKNFLRDNMTVALIKIK